jgi:hypothetical protein
MRCTGKPSEFPGYQVIVAEDGVEVLETLKAPPHRRLDWGNSIPDMSQGRARKVEDGGSKQESPGQAGV